MKRLFLLIIWLMIINFSSCFINSKSPEIKEQTVDKIVSKIVYAFASSKEMSKSKLKVGKMNIIIDTMVGVESFDITEKSILEFYRDFSSLSITGIIPEYKSFANYLSENFPNSYIVYSNDNILKMNKNIADKKLRDEESVLIKYSRFFKLPDQPIYFFSFYFYCGKLCGGQYFIRFTLDETGNFKDYSIDSLFP